MLPGHPLSPLDAEIERSGVSLVDAYFAQSDVAKKVSAAFTTFMGDVEANRVLKKAMHISFEQSMRGAGIELDPPDNHGFGQVSPLVDRHPMTAALLRGASLTTKDVSASVESSTSTQKLWGALLSWTLVLPVAALFTTLRYGRFSVTPRRAVIASPNFWETDFWETLRDIIIARGEWQEDTLLFVNERPEEMPAWAERIELNDCHVPVLYWISHVVGPSVVLSMKAIWTAMQSKNDARDLECVIRGLNLAASSFHGHRISLNVKARYYLDIADYSTQHGLKASFFRRVGMQLFRWPFAQIEAPGTPLSYLDYDIFANAGPYQAETYRDTWRSGMKTLSVGQLRNDQRIAEGVRLQADIATKIQDQINVGKKLVVIFAGNDDAGFLQAGIDMYKTVIPMVADVDPWFVVIKPKKRETPKGAFQQALSNPEVGRAAAANNVMVLPHDGTYLEVCTSGWLIEKMTFGITMPGSVHLEALARDKPAIAYFPISQETPLRQWLKSESLLHDSLDGLRSEVAKQLDSKTTTAYDFEPVKRWCDPFADRQALDRLVDLLMSHESETSAGLNK